jgi:hypothetical protein
MVISRERFQFIQKDFDVAVGFDCLVRLVTRRLGLLKDSIDVEILNCRVEVQLPLESPEELMTLRRVRLFESLLHLMKEGCHLLVVPS